MTSKTWTCAWVFVLGCSSPSVGSDGGPAQDAAAEAEPDAGVVTQSVTWTDGTMLDAPVLIPEGVTITIAPGATVTCASAVTITVQGTLIGSSAQPTHAKLAGVSWGGLVVANKGTLALDGVDVSGAKKTIDLSSITPAKYDNGTITSSVPFTIAKGSALSTSRSSVVKPTEQSVIQGSFTASYLDYDSNGWHAIMAADPTARVLIEDSKFHGGPSDLLNAYGASFFHVAYTDVTGAHCGFHFTAVDTLEIDHVTVHGVTNGADLWGSSSAGKHTIDSSNFESLSVSLDESGANGPIDVTNCWLTGTNNLAQSSAVKISSPAAQRIPNAGPR
jgi:hypothetical protein